MTSLRSLSRSSAVLTNRLPNEPVPPAIKRALPSRLYIHAPTLRCFWTIHSPFAACQGRAASVVELASCVLRRRTHELAGTKASGDWRIVRGGPSEQGVPLA